MEELRGEAEVEVEVEVLRNGNRSSDANGL